MHVLAFIEENTAKWFYLFRVQNRWLEHRIYRWMFLMKYGTNCCYSTAKLLVVHSRKHFSSACFFPFTKLTLRFKHIAAIKVLEKRIRQRDGAPFLWRLLVFFKSLYMCITIDSGYFYTSTWNDLFLRFMKRWCAVTGEELRYGRQYRSCHNCVWESQGVGSFIFQVWLIEPKEKTASSCHPFDMLLHSVTII